MTDLEDKKPDILTDEQRKKLTEIVTRYPAKPDSGLLTED